MLAQWRLYGFRIAVALQLTGIAPADRQTAEAKRWSLFRHLLRFPWRGPFAFSQTSRDAMLIAERKMYGGG